jgi:uncharacterized protein
MVWKFSSAGPIVARSDGVALSVTVRPRAARNAVLGRSAAESPGGSILVAVSAPPAGGRANAALIEVLAESVQLPKSRVAVIAGAASRRKIVLLSGTPAVLQAQIAQWFDALPIL